MSRKIIRDFIKQADKLDKEQAAGYFDTIMEVYEDSVHTAAERVATLESDTLWLLIEYRKIVEAKDNTPEEKQQHRIAQSNLWQLLSVLIASTADKGIYLSEAFIKKYETVDFVGISFGKYVHDVYMVRKWQSQEPQHEAPEAPQYASEGNDGELTGNGNETPPEGNEYIELPLNMQTDDKRAEKVFTEAVNKGWLQVIDNQHGKWIGFAKSRNGRIKNYEQSLAWLIVEIYDPERNGINNWLRFEEYFGIYDLSKHWGNAVSYYNQTERKQNWQLEIDKLINSALRK